MQPGIRTHFFLGADSRYGYCSLIGSVLPSEECAVKYIIKGGSAFGKNAFINRLADQIQASGHDVECYRSSTMPEYLDGLYIPDTKTVFLDGEMPHEINALYPGAVETYMDISALYDAAGLRAQRDTVIALAHEISSARERLYRYLAAAGEISDNIDTVVKTDKIVATIKKRVRGLAAREFKGDKNKRGTAALRFLSAGEAPGFAAPRALCRRVCVLDNDFGLACEMLSGLRGAALSEGHDAIVCLDPFEPDKIAHLLLPGLGLAFISSAPDSTLDGDIYKHIRLDALPRETLPRPVKAALKQDRRLLRELLDKSALARDEVRRLSLELDAVYTGRLDPAEVAALADSYIK